MSDQASTNRREIIHISLGSNSTNSFSSHYLNLLGLAATSPTCEPNITHAIESNFLVPRCLFLDPGGSTIVQPANESFPREQAPSLYLQDANSLAYSKFSRYHQAPVSKSKDNCATFTTINDRHVNWDEMGEEEEEENEEDESRRLLREENEKREWESNRYILQERLENHWITEKEEAAKSDEQSSAHNLEGGSTEPSGTASEENNPDWNTFFAPPHPSRYRCELPYASNSSLVDSWDTYTMGNTSRLNQDWKENVLLENVRHILEDCDSVQGVTIATEGHGIYAGLTTTLLEELKLECRSAGRLLYNIIDNTNKYPEQETQGYRQKLLSYIENGLATSDIGQMAHAVIPLQLLGSNNSCSYNKSLFFASAEAAIAMETATSIYRRKGSSGILAGSHYFHHNSELSFGEFLAFLLPSSRHNLLELDSTRTTELSFLLPGTSIQLRRKQQQGRGYNSRQQRVHPGEWIQTKLNSYSPSDNSMRSLHQHWSLATALRSTSNDSSLHDELQCTMESMDIRYRPRTSMGLMLNQTLYDLTSGGYAAGAYWKVDPKEAVVSLLSNSTKSYTYAKNIALNMKHGLSHKFKGYHNLYTTNGILPEREDCMEALEYCLSLRDLYYPPEGSGLGDDEEGEYFDDGLG